MRVKAHVLAPLRILAVTGDLDALTVTDPANPEAFAFEISGPPQRQRQAIERGGRRATIWVLRFPGLVSNQRAKVSVPVNGTVWTAGNVASWPAAANAPISSAA